MPTGSPARVLERPDLSAHTWRQQGVGGRVGEMGAGLLWVPATLLAAMFQVARNTMQRRLVETIGTVGATQVRFLYGLPFSLVLLGLVAAATGERLPGPDGRFLQFLLFGSVSQVAATALMLAAMRERSFSVVTALTKTEPVQLALYGLLVLGDRLSAGAVAAIFIATIGVFAVGWTPRIGGEVRAGGVRPLVLGLVSGAMFACAALGLRGAILVLDSGSFLVRATTTLAWSLAAQTAILLVYLVLRDRPALAGSLRVWRSSLVAGLMGALASQFWFIGFALTAAANVRTLALVEVLMAQLVSRRLFRQLSSPRELAGIVLILLGVGLLLATAG